MRDYAKGIDSGHIEVLVQGNQLNEEYLNNLATKVEIVINKKVKIYTKKERVEVGVLIFEN